ncbi:MAG TPA: ornithine carbamoyltransferase [Acidimicrobiales bacterium]|jgi:ornithine carbamoyltransferase
MPNLFDLDDLSLADWEQILTVAVDPAAPRVLEGHGVALVFEKPSARTRNSSELAVVGLGGHPVYIQGAEVGIDERESAEDVARTLACYHRIICARVFDHRVLIRMAAALAKSGFSVPMVNLLSDAAHPCQAVADIITLRELLGPGSLAGRSLAYIGDANNMWTSLAKAALLEGMEVRIAAPAGYGPSADQLSQLAGWAERVGKGGTVHATTSPAEAAAGIDVLYTDVWTSMGQEGERAARLAAFDGFTIDDTLVSKASPDVVVLHCLPAHRGEEISESVLEGTHSQVWRQAAHRQTAMRGILSWAVQP